MGFVTCFLNGASQEIKGKLNKSRLLKFYQDKQLKKNSTKNSAEKNFKEDSQLNELWVFFIFGFVEMFQIQRTLFPGHSHR